MDEKNKTVIVVMLVCACAIGVGLMIAGTLQHTEEDYPMKETPPIIFIPTGEECLRGERVMIGNPINATDEDGGRVWCWLYECRSAARNRTNIKVDATRLPDYEQPK